MVSLATSIAHDRQYRFLTPSAPQTSQIFLSRGRLTTSVTSLPLASVALSEARWYGFRLVRHSARRIPKSLSYPLGNRGHQPAPSICGLTEPYNKGRADATIAPPVFPKICFS